ncbi:UBX domain-containing protein 8 [Porites harrisoni]
MKQFLQDNKVDIYKENVLAPREEALRAKKEAAFYKFNSNWKGKGFRLRDDGQAEGEDDFFSQEFLDDENDSSEEGSDAVNTSETTQDNVSTWKSKQEFLRQRKQTYQLPDEPDLQEKGVITVALRCPDGAVKRRRFTVESQIKMLYVFAEWLGYSSSRYVISTTFPRKQLSEVTQTFLEAGLTGYTALALEEI